MQVPEAGPSEQVVSVAQTRRPKQKQKSKPGDAATNGSIRSFFGRDPVAPVAAPHPIPGGVEAMFAAQPIRHKPKADPELEGMQSWIDDAAHDDQMTEQMYLNFCKVLKLHHDVAQLRAEEEEEEDM